MEWTSEKVVEWHKKTFPDCTYESQLAKLDEKLKKVIYYQKKGKYKRSYDYMVDVYIVSLALLKRYNSSIGSFFLGLERHYPVPDLVKRFNRKMDINAKRTWQKVNGVYRHINKKIDYIEDKTPDLNKKPS